MFRIDMVKQYPVDYTACTEVAQRELNENARPRLARQGGRYGTVRHGLSGLSQFVGHDADGRTHIPRSVRLHRQNHRSVLYTRGRWHGL